jgi:hypothetical protein
VKTGTPAAFFSEDGGRDIQKSLIDYVANFVADAAGKRFNPYVTIGVGTEARRPPAGELPEAAVEHFTAPRFAMECGSS